MTELGDYLRSLRGKYSLRDIADRTNGELSHNTIAMAEKGTNTRGKVYNPSIEVLKALAKVYDIDPLILFKKAGYLKNIDIVQVPNLNANLPVYGAIHAGNPAFADQNIIGQVSVTDELIKKYGAENLFALQVKGDSMNKKILAGMIAIFAKDIGIESGDIVAVLIDGQDATIKKYRETSMAVLFEPQSYDPSFQPIIFQKSGFQDFRILGKMVYFVSGKYI